MLTEDAYTTNADFKGKRLLDQTFTEQYKFFEYDYDTNDLHVPPKPKAGDEGIREYAEAQYANDLNKRKREATREFWGKHRQIKHATDLKNGFKPDLPPVAVLEIISQRELDNHLKDMKRVEVFNRVMNYNDQELLDVALYYKPILYGKSVSKIRYGLIGLAGIGTPESIFGGALLQPEVIDDFLMNYNSANPTISMKIYVSKAIAMGILVPSTGGYSLQNGTFVGKEVNEIVVYFTTDMQSYTNIIQPEVNKRSELPENDMDGLAITWKSMGTTTADKEVIQNAKNAQYYADLKRVQDEYKSLGGRADLGYNDMKAWILEKHAEKATIAQKEALPTKALEMEVEPWLTEDLDKLKALAKDLTIPGYAMYLDTPESKAKLREKIKAKMLATSEAK